MRKIDLDTLWFATYAEEIAGMQHDPAERIETVARKANAYYNDIMDKEIAPYSEEEAGQEVRDEIDDIIRYCNKVDATLKLRDLVERCSHFMSICNQFLINAPGECSSAREYMTRVIDCAQTTVTSIYERANLHGLSIEDTIIIGANICQNTRKLQTQMDQEPSIEEPDEDGDKSIIETRNGCLIEGSPNLQPININKTFNKLCNDAGVFDNTRENRQLFTNMLYNAGGVRIAGHLIVKSRKTTALTYFVTQLETAVTRLNPPCRVITDKWKVIEEWCRNSKGKKFGDNVLAASNSVPQKSNIIDDAVRLLFEDNTNLSFSVQKKV